jgi:signal peptide peptidase SppA
MIENLQHAWAIRRDMAPVIAARLAGKLTADEARARLQALGRSAFVEDPATPEAAGGVAVLRLKGVITPAPSLLSLIFGFGGGGLMGFRDQLRQAQADESIKSILIDVDSPGGLTDLVPETAAEIRNATKPTVAIANVDAASAAYWLASQADELVVTPSGMVGSIGVFTMHEDWSGFNAQMGVKPTYVSAGRFKVEGNPDAPLSDDAKAAMQGMVDHFYDLFTADVALGRGVSQEAVQEGFGEGRMAVASEALELGMVDRIETFEDTFRRLSGSAEPAGVVAASKSARQARLDALAAKPKAEVPEPTPTDPPAPEQAPVDPPAPAPEPEPEPTPDPAPAPEPSSDPADDAEDDTSEESRADLFERRLAVS